MEDVTAAGSCERSLLVAVAELLLMNAVVTAGSKNVKWRNLNCC
jgi:hypothetical protein